MAKVTIDKNELVIRIPMEKDYPQSKSGKTRIIATTKGNRPTDLKIDGHVVVIGVNAYFKEEQ